MPSEPAATPELLEQLQRERVLLAVELEELAERHSRMVEAKGEETFSGHLRRAIHSSGRLVRDIAAEAGVSSQALCEFLEGTRTCGRTCWTAWRKQSVPGSRSNRDVPSESTKRPSDAGRVTDAAENLPRGGPCRHRSRDRAPPEAENGLTSRLTSFFWPATTSALRLDFCGSVYSAAIRGFLPSDRSTSS